MLQPADVLVNLLNDRPRYIILISHPAATDDLFAARVSILPPSIVRSPLSWKYSPCSGPSSDLFSLSPSLLRVLKELIDLSRNRLWMCSRSLNHKRRPKAETMGRETTAQFLVHYILCNVIFPVLHDLTAIDYVTNVDVSKGTHISLINWVIRILFETFFNAQKNLDLLR